MPASFANLNLPTQQLANLGNLGYKLMTGIQAKALPPRPTRR
jgi:Superfamily II DNA and RNA helicases